jgi:hypothetical protein
MGGNKKKKKKPVKATPSDLLPEGPTSTYPDATSAKGSGNTRTIAAKFEEISSPMSPQEEQEKV